MELGLDPAPPGLDPVDPPPKLGLDPADPPPKPGLDPDDPPPELGLDPDDPSPKLGLDPSPFAFPNADGLEFELLEPDPVLGLLL